jgi:regulatory protein
LNAYVAAVEPLDRRALRLRLTLDDGSSLELATEVVERAGVGAGDALDEAARLRLEDADLRWRAREAVLGLVARRPYSREELRRRLRRAGFGKAVVDDCLAVLEAQRLVDDGAFAKSFVRDRLRLRPRGRRRLSQELREKGVDAETIDDALAEVFAEQEVREDDLAREAAIGWLKRQRPEARDALSRTDRSPEREKATRRLGGFLARRGFGGEAARTAIQAAAEAVRGGAAPGSAIAGRSAVAADRR